MPSYEEFTNFLEKAGCLEEFRTAYRDQNRRAFTEDVYDSLPFASNVINVSFDWNKTGQGRSFWKAADDKWDALCDSLPRNG
jgi:hypothetical protein